MQQLPTSYLFARSVYVNSTLSSPPCYPVLTRLFFKLILAWREGGKAARTVWGACLGSSCRTGEQTEEVGLKGLGPVEWAASLGLGAGVLLGEGCSQGPVGLGCTAWTQHKQI